MTDLLIGEGTQVTLYFSLKLDDGEVVDSNMDSEAATFSVGDGNLLPGFERVLFGMGAGEKASFVIPPEDAFGQANPNNIQKIDRSLFTQEFELSEGLVISFADAAGAESPGVIVELKDDSVLVDFNHPLSGEKITFEVQIVSVSPAVTH
ncbi:FKBP-type peptidyl-prolyl cis-trans isomerase SlpA [Alteromonadaceae bacterium Bs31]|nr:FKBP-type peptidyl-prolyl cis-trans isomerase SlpA [Alteromonadaceae bacterium Bs31]